ncbi:MAG TPA: cobalamin-binding protein [Gammaproteobacteria bacterium]|nr:cobalamin-binding protein [Gammaproteobacteria bacterium]
MYKPDRRAASRLGLWACVMVACLVGPPAHAAVSAVDDMGRTVTLDAPARRIVSLAPSVAELLFAAGAGKRVVGTVRYTDYPPAARHIPRVGDATRIDMERILTLNPDLVVAWHSSLPAQTLKRLTDLGLTVYITEPRALAMIAADIKKLGRLAGSAHDAETAAAQFTARLQGLRRRYSHQSPVRVFFQTWDRPVMTVNGAHFISHLLRLCGGRNVFADLGPLSASVSAETVLAADPQAIMAGVKGGDHRDVFARWRRWSGITAVRLGNLFTLPDDLINRPGPRIVQAADRMCRDLAAARRRIDMAGVPVHHSPPR